VPPLILVPSGYTSIEAPFGGYCGYKEDSDPKVASVGHSLDFRVHMSGKCRNMSAGKKYSIDTLQIFMRQKSHSNYIRKTLIDDIIDCGQICKVIQKPRSNNSKIHSHDPPFLKEGGNLLQKNEDFKWE